MTPWVSFQPVFHSETGRFSSSEATFLRAAALMLFLLKRTWPGSLTGLAVLFLAALCLRHVLGGGPSFVVNFSSAGLGLAVCACVLFSDGLLHSLLSWSGGARYRQRFQELAGVFRRQSVWAIAAGSLMAGLGEEPFFRGLSTDPMVLGALAVVFGLLHHVRRSLWPFTLWAIYEGLLFAAALYFTGNLFVTMVAHCLHDLVGFWILRREANRFAQ
jgi:hypothetical protein